VSISQVFIDHPRVAFVVSILIAFCGALCLNTIPVAEYPEIAPTTIYVTASYPGASSEVIAETVAIPIEDQINAVDDLLSQITDKDPEDVVAAIRKASVGRHKMTSADWQQLFAAVDELQPDLMERLVHHVGKFSEQQQQVCYLLSIGLTNTQIENLTDLPHVTVWRWAKKLEWAQNSGN